MAPSEGETTSAAGTSADGGGGGIGVGWGATLIMVLCGGLVYYHCWVRHASLVSLAADVLIVLICSLAILGMLFRQLTISVPVDPLEWQISQDTANAIFACVANTVGAAESVLRVAAAGHDKRLFLRVVLFLYLLSTLGRLASGVTVAYGGFCLYCLYMFAQNLQLVSRRFTCQSQRDSTGRVQEAI